LWTQLFRLPEQPGLSIQARLRAVIAQSILDGRLGAACCCRPRASWPPPSR
jgi:GntR family transcriptional regulator/MocR family aminotransferase